jgi:hypothetical protein
MIGLSMQRLIDTVQYRAVVRV